MTSRPATAKEVRKHLKDAGYEVRIDSTEQVNFRRNRDRFPGSQQTWLCGGVVDDYRVDDERGVYIR